MDYEALAMLNVPATQESHRRVEAQATEMAALKTQLARLGDLPARVAMLVAQAARP